jgi:DNA-binding MarR family transcriptional regulator
MHKMRRVDVGCAMSIGASSVSHLGDPLEKQGLVRKENDARDARVFYMVLTEAGLKLVEAAEQTLQELAARLFDERWTESDLQQFRGRLGQLVYGSTSHLVD